MYNVPNREGKMKTLLGRGFSFRPILEVFAVCVMAVATISSGNAYGQAIAELYTPKAPIPKGSYKSWSLFLVNNPQWVVAESNQKIMELYDRFQAFGRAIGRDHLAVWFWSQNNLQDSFYYKAVDVIRSASFCGKLKLTPSGGPYLFVTTDYPGAGLMNDSSTFLPTPPTNYYLVSLNDKSADEVMQLLTRVADNVTAERIADLNSDSEKYWGWWQKVWEGLRDFLKSRQMSVTIKTPVSDIRIE